MAVPKIAVIALVAVIAVPILLGYALNLTEVTETDYIMSDDNVNVTPLLQDGYEYNYVAANVVDVNTRFYESGVPGNSPVVADYNKFTTTKSSIQLSRSLVNNGVPSLVHNLSDFKYYYFILDYNPSDSNYAIVTVTYNDDTTNSIYAFHSLYYNAESQKLYVSNYTRQAGGIYTDSGLFGILSNVKSVQYSKVGNVGTGMMYYYQISNPPSTYVDLSAGYKLNTYSQVHSIGTTYFNSQQWNNNMLISMDLSSITSSSYSFEMNNYRFVKTTDGSGAHWKVQKEVSGVYQDLTDLYYDSSKSSNTYQILLDLNAVTFRYVGFWPTIMGVANSYWEYVDNRSSPVTGVDLSISGISPKMRIDAADYRAYQYPVIENETYDPSQFRSNPATTISNPQIYGTSITFGGNTYTVSKGNITLGSHQIPVKGLVLNSIPVEGGYENRIGNTVISTTATPSTITFNGKWSVDITTVSQTQTTYTKTEWNAGSFAWDGMDSNFLIVGLVTCLGVFVALGIYARKSRSGGIIPLMIVTGCAAALFFIML